MKKFRHQFCYLCLFLGINIAVAETDTLKVGQAAPDFRVSSIQGDSFSLSELRADGHVLLYFWSSRCHVCHSLITQINALHIRYRKRNVVVVGLNIGYEQHQEVKKYLQDNHLGFLILNDDSRKEILRKQYSLVSTPGFVLVSPQGEIKYLGHAIPDLEKFIPAREQTKK